MRWARVVVWLAIALNAAQTLGPGKHLEREIAPGASVEIPLAPAKGYAELNIEPRGARISVAGSDWRLDLAHASPRPVRMCWLAAGAPVTLSLKSVETASTRRVALSFSVRTAGPEDVPRVRGCLLQSQARSERRLAQRAELLTSARDAFQQAGDFRGLGEVLTPLGEALWDLGRQNDSIAAHEQAAAAWGRAGLPGRAAGAMVMLGRGCAQLAEKRSKAMKTWLAAAELAKSAGDPVSEAEALSSIVNDIAVSGGSMDGRALSERAIELFRQAGDRAGEAVAWNSRARWQWNSSVAEALASDRKALELRQGLEDEAGIAQSLNNLAAGYDRAGEPEKSLELLEQALAIRKRLGTPFAIANTQHNLGVQYFLRGESDRALSYYEQAMTLWRKNGYQAGEAATLTEIGLTHLGEGNLDRAERAFREALALNRAIGNRRSEANVLQHLGSVAHSRRQFEKAEELELRALEIARGGKFLAEEARARRRRAVTLSRTGRLVEARAELEKSKEISKTINRSDFLAAQIALAELLRESGDARASLREFEEAERLANELNSIRDSAPASAGKTLTLLALGEIPRARAEADKALRLVETLRNYAGSPAARAGALDRRHLTFFAAASAMIRSGEPDAAFEASERGRARSLIDLLAAADDPRRTPENAAERGLRASLSAKSALLERMQLRQAKVAETGPVRAEIARLEEEYSVLERRMAREHPELARAAQPSRLPEIRARLGQQDGVIEFLLGPDRGYAWLVTRDRLETAELPPRREIENAVAAIRKEMNATSASGAAPHAGLAALSGLLFRGALGPTAFTKLRKVYIVPDGDLHFAPFPALAPLRGCEIVVLPSASLLTFLPRSAAKGQVAVFADPVYEPLDTRLRAVSGSAPAASRGADEAHRFPRLRFSAIEAESIRKLAGGSTMTGFRATRAAFERASRDRFAVLHFATHALTYPDQPGLSAIVLSLHDEQGKPVDGFLRMYDIARLRLRSPLVVLSACDTAVGRRLEGEGPLGISRTFLAAGASGVVATLWAVDDAATAAFMSGFYKGLLERGLAPSAALRLARDTVAAQPRWAHPYYWAGFLYTGR